MSKKKLRRKNNMEKTEFHPHHRIYYRSGDYKILLRETKNRSQKIVDECRQRRKDERHKN